MEDDNQWEEYSLEELCNPILENTTSNLQAATTEPMSSVIRETSEQLFENSKSSHVDTLILIASSYDENQLKNENGHTIRHHEIVTQTDKDKEKEITECNSCDLSTPQTHSVISHLPQQTNSSHSRNTEVVNAISDLERSPPFPGFRDSNAINNTTVLVPTVTTNPQPPECVDIIKEMRERERKKQEEHKKLLESRMKQLAEEEEKQENEYEETIMKKRKEAEILKKKQQEDLLRIEEEMEEQERRKEENDRKKVEDKHEKIRKKLSNEAKMREAVNQKEIEIMKKEGDIEGIEIEKQRQRMKMEKEQRIKDQDEKFVENSKRQEAESEKRKEELKKVKKEEKVRLRKMIDQLERDKEKMRGMHKEKMNEMKQQWENIMKMMQLKLWNEVIERNWTNRLNVLRSANRKVSELFNRFHTEAIVLQRNLEKKDDVTNEKKIVTSIVKSFIQSIESERAMMKEEAENLEIELKNTGKHFVYCIKDSVEKVKWNCEQLKEHLENYAALLRNNRLLLPCEHNCVMEQIKKGFENLSRSSIRIPTLAELKRQYNEEMKQESTSNTNRDLVPFHSIIIEEFE